MQTGSGGGVGSAGVTWTPRIIGKKLNGITYGKDKFVAVGEDGIILTSPDGNTWELKTPWKGNHLFGVAYGEYSNGNGNHLFVVAGQSGAILTSQDGIGWTLQYPWTNNHLRNNHLRGVSYGKGLFVVVGEGSSVVGKVSNILNFQTHHQGSPWEIKPVPVEGQKPVEDKKTGNSINLNAVTYGNNTFVAVGDNGAVFSLPDPPDGASWTKQTSGTSNHLYGIAYGKDLFVAVGDNGTILTSPDGVEWMVWTLPITKILSGIAYEDNTFVVVGQDGTILTSPDGITWTAQNSGTSNWLRSVAYGNGRFVVVGDGVILTSP